MESFDKLKAQKDAILAKQDRALSKARETLRKIAEQDAENCDCDHSTDECCVIVGEPCPKCLAELALSGFSSEVDSVWISVADKLPEEDEEVLIWYGDFVSPIRIAWIHQLKGEGRYRWIVMGDTAAKPEQVTHWMPLPKSPKGDSK